MPSVDVETGGEVITVDFPDGISLYDIKASLDEKFAPVKQFMSHVWQNMSPLDKAAVGTMMIPIVGDATGLAADIDMYVKDPESRTVLNGLFTAAGVLPLIPAASQVKKGIKAYHGSPHNVDKFSMDKIGTGEGAQAYGHGLYFAEAEDTAKQYRNSFNNDPMTGDAFFRVGDREIAGRAELKDELFDNASFSGDIDDFDIEDAANYAVDEMLGGTTRVHARDLNQDALVEARRALEGVTPANAHMYEVNLDVDPDDLLDWDRAINDQTQPIKDAVIRAVPDVGESLKHNPDIDFRDIADNFDDLTSDELSSRLLDEGIPGIKYLDGVSRDAGKGTRNYVMFDDSLISIAKKYGLPLTAAGMATAARIQNEDDEYKN